MKNKKTAKGFTLIELIVVMAVFGLIMIGTFKFMDPVSRTMKRSVANEANSAVVDNIKGYLDGTLRYANAVWVYNGDFKYYSSTADGGDGQWHANGWSERDAVVDFVDNVYCDKADTNNDPAEVKVYLMKIDNGNGGRIYESEYTVKAGYHFYEPDGMGWTRNPVPEPAQYVSTQKVDEQVINEVFYKDNSLYITPGVYDMKVDHVDRDKDRYYGKVTESPNNLFTMERFALTAVTYNKDRPIEKNGSSLITDWFFQSPYAVSDTSLALVNMVNGNFDINMGNCPVRRKGGIYDPINTMVDVVKIEEDLTTNTVTRSAGSDGKWDYETNPTPAASRFRVCDTYNQAGGDYVYIIYTMPEV